MDASFDTFQGRHPEAYESFLASGWTNIRFAYGSKSPSVLKAVNPDAQEIEIALPKRGGMTVDDVSMLENLMQHNIILRPLRIDLAEYGAYWRFEASSKGDSWLEKRHKNLPDTKVHLNLDAKRHDDILLVVERLGDQMQAIKLSELDNLYKLGSFLMKHGWPVVA
jgi:hypothetical protein